MSSWLNRLRKLLRKAYLRLRQVAHIAKLLAGIVAAIVVAYVALTTTATNWELFRQAIELLFA